MRLLVLRHPVEEPLVGLIITRDFEIDEETPFQEQSKGAGRPLEDGESSTEAGESKSLR